MATRTLLADTDVKTPRWLVPYISEGTTMTSEVFTAGRVYLTLFEVFYNVTVDRLLYVVGATSNGNVRGGIYGPIVTEDTCTGAPLKVESSSTAQAAAANTQLLTLSSTLLAKGRYYSALQSDSNSGTFLRTANTGAGTAELFVGGTQLYTRGGGYGAYTDPCPAILTPGDGPIMRVRCVP